MQTQQRLELMPVALKHKGLFSVLCSCAQEVVLHLRTQENCVISGNGGKWSDISCGFVELWSK